jgi:hypothetical protein
MVLSLSSCGGAADERADATADEPADTQPADADDGAGTGVDTSSPDTVAPLPAACTVGAFTADVRIANAYAELEVVTDPAFGFTDAVAVRLQPGAYSVFLGDYDLDPALFASWETQHPPADHTLVQLYLTTFGGGGQIDTDPAELVAGDVIVASSEIDGSKVLGLTFERGLDAGDPPYLAYNTSSTPEGQAEVLGINETHLCLKVDYLDYEGASTTNGVADVYPVQKRFAATFTAEIVDF